MVVEELESLGFTKDYTLMFRRDGVNFVSRLPNGKVCLRDKKEKIEPEEGLEYECKVKELERVAFARIVCEAFIPRIIVRDEGVILVRRVNSEVRREMLPSVEEALKKVDDERVMVIRR